MNGNFKMVTYSFGNKANMKAYQKGIIKSADHGFPSMNYQNIKISTKNKNYKIKSVKLTLISKKGTRAKLFNGYGKTKLDIKLYEKYKNLIAVGAVVNYY